MGSDRHVDDPVIRLIRNENVAIRRVCSLYGGIELVVSSTGNAELPVLPDDSAAFVDQDDAIVRASVVATNFERRRRGRHASTCRKRERADSLGVVDSKEGRRRQVGWPMSKLPHDLAGSIDLDDTVVELIRYEDISISVEPTVRIGSQCSRVRAGALGGLLAASASGDKRAG